MNGSVSTIAAAAVGAALLWNSVSFGAEKLGTAEEAKAMLDHAAAAMKADGAAALKAFNDKADRQFHDRDLYVYCSPWPTANSRPTRSRSCSAPTSAN